MGAWDEDGQRRRRHKLRNCLPACDGGGRGGRRTLGFRGALSLPAGRIYDGLEPLYQRLDVPIAHPPGQQQRPPNPHPITISPAVAVVCVNEAATSSGDVDGRAAPHLSLSLSSPSVDGALVGITEVHCVCAASWALGLRSSP